MSASESGHDGLWVVRRTRRLWTDEEKLSICLQTTAADVSVAQVARRYALNANMIFKWLRDARYAPGSVQYDSGYADYHVPPLATVMATSGMTSNGGPGADVVVNIITDSDVGQ